MRLISGTAVVVAVLAVTNGFLLVPADAATTSSGTRCTIVGTPGDDVLIGTSGRDVICGLGGDDTIKGRGGNDLIDGGRGDDDILAGRGKDRVLGGPGADDVAGGGGDDALLGGGGPDDIGGGGGADDLFGGPGGDEISGGGGGDLLAGQKGNDDLAGGAGPDDVRGGPGANWCTIDSADTRTRCVYDKEPAQVVAAALSKDTVDVTSASERFRVRVRITDDTGVAEVRASLNSDDDTFPGVSFMHGYLVSGDARDGIWQVDSMVRRWSAPGSFYLGVSVKDRIGHRSDRYFPAKTLTVKDRNPDLDPPQVTLLRPGPDAPSVDVRSSRQDVVVKARVTDAVSGVMSVSMCLLKPQDGYYSNLPCIYPDLVDGDDHDGVWRGTVTIPRGATGGDWNVEVAADDRTGANGVRYMGPDFYRYWSNDGSYTDPSFAPFPGGRGRFEVLGTNDSAPAAIDEVRISPKTVDTLGGPVTVTVRVHATDAPGEGVTSVGGVIAGGNPDGTSDSLGTPDFFMDDFTLVDGNRVDGWWEGQAVLPQGTPVGSYYLQVWVDDIRHWRSYVSEPSDSNPDNLRIPGDSVVEVAEHVG